MRRKSNQIEAENFGQARNDEQRGLTEKAIKGYSTILKKNPLHLDATARLLVLFRKTKNIDNEIALLRTSIASHEKHIEKAQQAWIAEHRQIAEDSRELAKMLGLLNAKELPFYEHEVLQKWKKRLDGLEARSTKIKAKVSKKTSSSKAKA